MKTRKSKGLWVVKVLGGNALAPHAHAEIDGEVVSVFASPDDRSVTAVVSVQGQVYVPKFGVIPPPVLFRGREAAMKVAHACHWSNQRAWPSVARGWVREAGVVCEGATGETVWDSCQTA